MQRIKLKTDKLFTNISSELRSLIPEDFHGFLSVYTPHTTCALTLLEDELLHHLDVRLFLDLLAPKDKPIEGPYRNTKYFHDMISLRQEVGPDERINGHSHIRSLFFDDTVLIPVEAGELVLGEYKQCFLVELDPVRERELLIGFIAAQ